MTDILSMHWFYPMLFTTIIAIAIITGLVITKLKDSNLFNNIFNKHTDEHIDTTDKMKSMHDNVVKADFTQSHEKEIHDIETRLKKVEQDIIENNKKLDFLLENVVKNQSS